MNTHHGFHQYNRHALCNFHNVPGRHFQRHGNAMTSYQELAVCTKMKGHECVFTCDPEHELIHSAEMAAHVQNLQSKRGEKGEKTMPSVQTAR